MIGRRVSRTSTQTSGIDQIGTGASGASQGRTPKEMPEQPRQSIQLPIATGAKDKAIISVFQRLQDKFAEGISGLIGGFYKLTARTPSVLESLRADKSQQRAWASEAKRARQAASTADQGRDRRDRQPTEETGGMRELEGMVQRRRQDARADEAGILGSQQAIIEQQRDIDDTKQTFALYHQQSTRTSEYIAWLDQQIQIGVQHQIEAQATKPVQESKLKPQESVEYSSPSPFD